MGFPRSTGACSFIGVRTVPDTKPVPSTPTRKHPLACEPTLLHPSQLPFIASSIPASVHRCQIDLSAIHPLVKHPICTNADKTKRLAEYENEEEVRPDFESSVADWRSPPSMCEDRTAPGASHHDGGIPRTSGSLTCNQAEEFRRGRRSMTVCKKQRVLLHHSPAPD